MIRSAAYEIIKEEGIKEGEQQGLQQGLRQGIKQTLIDTLEIRFETVPLRIIDNIDKVKNPELLRLLHQLAVMSDSLKSFEKKMEAVLKG